jgi:hypothetical protein
MHPITCFNILHKEYTREEKELEKYGSERPKIHQKNFSADATITFNKISIFRTDSNHILQFLFSFTSCKE